MILGGCLAALGLGAATAMAQPGGGNNGFGGGANGFGGGRGGGRGGITPDQMRSDMEVKDEAEWTAISAKIAEVQTAQQGVNNRGGRGRGNRGNRGNNAAGATAPATPLADALAELQKAYDDNAKPAEIKDKMAKVQDLRKSARAELIKAQDELRALLTSRQEAYLMLNTTYLN
jgi:hypothetical protein